MRMLKEFLFRGLVGNTLAAVLIVTGIWLVPQLVLDAYNSNIIWVSAVWHNTVAPLLPADLRLAGDAVGAANGALVSFINLANKFAGNDVRSEVLARTFLVGEAVLLMIELSIIIRLGWSLWDKRRRLGEWATWTLGPVALGVILLSGVYLWTYFN